MVKRVSTYILQYMTLLLWYPDYISTSFKKKWNWDEYCQFLPTVKFFNLLYHWHTTVKKVKKVTAYETIDAKTFTNIFRKSVICNYTLLRLVRCYIVFSSESCDQRVLIICSTCNYLPLIYKAWHLNTEANSMQNANFKNWEKLTY